MIHRSKKRKSTISKKVKFFNNIKQVNKIRTKKKNKTKSKKQRTIIRKEKKIIYIINNYIKMRYFKYANKKDKLAANVILL